MSIREVILVFLFLVVVSTANTADTSTTAEESSSSVVDDVIRFLRGGGNRQLGKTPAAPKWVPTKQPSKQPTKQPSKQPSKLPTRSPTISVSLRDVLLTKCVHFLSHWSQLIIVGPEIMRIPAANSITNLQFKCKQWCKFKRARMGNQQGKVGYIHLGR